MNENIELRYTIAKSMNNLMSFMNNEDAYAEWVETVPDCATDDDLWDISRLENAEIFNDMCKLFNRIVKRYGKDGYCVKTETYGC